MTSVRCDEEFIECTLDELRAVGHVTVCFDRELQAMKADAIPNGSRGLWTIDTQSFEPWVSRMMLERHGRCIPPGQYQYLWRLTESTLVKPPGDCVMNDTPEELRKHLQFALTAHGRVLVTGLGLGCVARGLLLNDRVESIEVVERDADVLALVAGYMPADPRLTIHHADAIAFINGSSMRWDCAWHDHLQVVHAELIAALVRRVRMQGAWAFPRRYRRAMAFAGVI